MRGLVEQAVIDWDAAAVAVGAAVEHAAKAGWKINAAVVDSGGNLAAFLRMPGAPLPSIDIAIDKAYTAVGFGIATSRWPTVLAGSPPEVRDGLPRRPRMVCFGGGLPIEIDGRRVGAIGVSGASQDQDEACARAGIIAVRLLD